MTTGSLEGTPVEAEAALKGLTVEDIMKRGQELSAKAPQIPDAAEHLASTDEIDYTTKLATFFKKARPS